MFFINEGIEFIVVDYDYVDNAIEVLESLYDLPLTVHVISSILDEDDIEYFKHRKVEGEIHFDILDEDESEIDWLRQFLRERRWKFDDLFVTGNTFRAAIANEVAIGTVLLKDDILFGDVKKGPDLCINPGQFVDLVENEFHVGHAGEMLLDGAPHLLPGAGKATRKLKLIQYQSHHREFDNLYSLGRYFRRDDPFMNHHLYTRFIKKCKNDPNLFAKQTSYLLNFAVKEIQKIERIKGNCYLTFVPKKPDDVFGRNEIILQNLKDFHDIDFYTFLICPNQYPSQKDIRGGEDEKRDNVRGKFECTYELEEANVILFDDVYTTGSTLAECASMLLDSGASKVVPFTLGIVCDSVITAPLLSLSCTCGVQMKIMFNGSDGKAFWGCPSYQSPGHHITHDYADGITKLRRLWRDAEAFPIDNF